MGHGPAPSKPSVRRKRSMPPNRRASRKPPVSASSTRPETSKRLRSSPGTPRSSTGDIDADWDIDQLTETMRLVLEGDSEEGSPVCESCPRPIGNPCKWSSGGGGNRTRVRGRTEQSVYERSPCLISPAGRFTDDQPTGQPSCVVTPQAIGSPL